jgi:P27 family predicted phage terminase small subunit
MAAERPRKARLTAVPASSNGRARLKIPDAPKDLDVSARALWRSIWSLPRVEPADRASVVRLCRLETEAGELRKILAKDGRMLSRVIQNSRGDVVGSESYSHPASGELRKIGREAAAACDSLGLSPAARKRMGLELTLEPGHDALDDLQERRKARRAGEGKS